MRWIYLVPNFFTSINMFCGFFALKNCVESNFTGACWSIVIAGFFDMLDGQVARLTKATSSFGLQYDTLSDLVSFGVAPSILLYQFGLKEYAQIGILIGFLFLLTGALRLARFNIRSKDSDLYSQGLPITIAGGLVGTSGLVLHLSAQGLVFLTIFLSFLMISNLHFISLKKLQFRTNSILYFLILVIFVFFLCFRTKDALFYSLVLYILTSLMINIYTWVQSFRICTKK